MNKAVLTQRFFDSAAVSLKKIYTVAIRELEGWLRSLMTPLESQVREHQAQLRRRMESVQRVMDAGDSLEERLQEIDEARARIERQLAQMKTLVEGVQAAIDRRPVRPVVVEELEAAPDLRGEPAAAGEASADTAVQGKPAALENVPAGTDEQAPAVQPAAHQAGSADAV